MEEWSPFRAYSHKHKGIYWQDAFTLFLLGAGALWLYMSARELPAYAWHWQSLLNFLYIATPDQIKPGLLLQGLITTLRVGIWTFLFSLLFGGALGLCAVRKPALLLAPYQALINILRNTPPLVILFCVYFFAGNILPVTPIEDALRAFPDFWQTIFHWCFAPAGQMDRMLAAVLALGIYQGIYVAEIIRGSLNAVPEAQWDASLSLGFGRLATLMTIILPQGLRLALPALTGQCITTFKESSLASLISLPDLTFQSLEIMAVTGMTFEVWISAAALYLLLGLICAWIGSLLEKRFSYQF